MPDSVIDCHPTDEECRELVRRILGSKEFQRARRLRDFLSYVVDRKLADSPQELTETLIGHHVFGRPEMYNTGEDSIVRTEARIIRQRLERYFAGDGLNEPIVLEIPRGGYVPVFRRRDTPVEHKVLRKGPAKKLGRLSISLVLGACTVAALLAAWRFTTASSIRPYAVLPVSVRPAGLVEVESSDPRLVRSFQWAKQRALAYSYTGDPVGDWYDSTAGKRYAFCMRDLSHQSVGAAVLGLTGHTRNMLRRFAGSISLSRDWCGFWEINKDGFPAPVDYQDDRHFWYCLPANFDLMQACYRQFLWTGDQSYFDSVFSNFYDRTVTDYPAAWDRNRDGVMESSPEVRPRGIPSYYQEQLKLRVGADLLAAQYKGYLVYAAIQEQRGVRGSLSQKLAEQYREKALALRILYNTEWWNAVQSRHYSLMLADGKFFAGYVADANVFPLLFGLTEDGLKTNAALDGLEKNRPDFDQTLSYFPEILFEYGRNESAYHSLLELTDPNFRGRGMPEVVFAAAGALATGLMGISPDALQHTLETLPRLPGEVGWVKLTRLPILQNEVSIQHRAVTETAITNMAGPLFHWKASFSTSSPGRAPLIMVDGAPLRAKVEERVNHQTTVFVLVPVSPGQTRTARYVASRL